MNNGADTLPGIIIEVDGIALKGLHPNTRQVVFAPLP